MVEQSEKFVCVRIDTDKDPDTTSKYGVEGIPTLLYLNSKGEKIKECEAQKAEEMAKDMEKLAKEYKPPEENKK